VLQGNFELTSLSILDFSPECRLTNGLREDIRKPKEKKRKHSAVKRQCLRAENIIIEWQRAQEMLPTLREAAEEDDVRSIQARPGSTVPHESPNSRSSSTLVKNHETTLAVIEAAAASASGSKSEKRALVLRNTDNWLSQLLSEWTVLSGEAPEIERDVNQDTLEELLHEDQSPATNVESPEPTKVKSGEHVGDLDVRTKRAEEGLAGLHQEKRVSPLLGQSWTPTQDYWGGRIYEELEPSDFSEGDHYYREREQQATSGKYDPFERDYYYREKEPQTTSGKYERDYYYREKEPQTTSGKHVFERDYYDREKEPQTTSGKYDVSELKRRPYVRELEKERKSTERPEKAANALPFNIAAKFKEKAKQKTQERETTDKQSNRRAYVEDDSSSGPDTATYGTINKPQPRTSKPVYDLPPHTKSKPEPTRRPTLRREKEENWETEEDEEDKWQSRRVPEVHSRHPKHRGAGFRVVDSLS
jgi:hypothetical protein